MKRLRVALIALACLLLAACAGRAIRPVPPSAAVEPAALAAAEAAQAQRVAWLDAHPRWTLAGRIAISNAGKGGSGRIDWTQHADGSTVSLSAPVTRQSWRMTVGLRGARLEGLEGGVREGSNPAQLLLDATGWEVPVEALAQWARGRLAATGPASGVTYSAEGRLRSLQQDGWRIDYLAWHEPAGDRPALPARIDAQRGEAKVRLIVDRWEHSAQ
jgi:outer membrane lipoprotein LolB